MPVRDMDLYRWPGAKDIACAANRGVSGSHLASLEMIRRREADDLCYWHREVDYLARR